MRQVLNRLKLGTFTLAGFTLVVFGAAGYASFAETEHQCSQAPAAGEYIAGTFIPEQKR